MSIFSFVSTCLHHESVKMENVLDVDQNKLYQIILSCHSYFHIKLENMYQKIILILDEKMQPASSDAIHAHVTPTSNNTHHNKNACMLRRLRCGCVPYFVI